MTKLQELHIKHSEAQINLEVAQSIYNQVKQNLAQEINEQRTNGKQEATNESLQVSEPCT